MVFSNDSPLVIEDESGSISIYCAPKFNNAISKEDFVLVLGSKKRIPTFLSP